MDNDQFGANSNLEGLEDQSYKLARESPTITKNNNNQ